MPTSPAILIRRNLKAVPKTLRNEFWLKSETMTVSHERSPIVSSLPGIEPILIDLGQWRVVVTIEGVADFTVDPADKEIISGVQIAYIDDLETIPDPTTPSGGWHLDDIFIEDRTVAGFTRTYQVYINNITVVKDRVREFYNFKLQASGFKV